MFLERNLLMLWKREQNAMAGNFNRHKIIEQLLADNIHFMFGNPGTVEQGFLDALSEYPDMQYILSLQESIAVMMADGYARASQQAALVQIHSTPGLGNAIGALYQAYRGHAPLVVIGSDAGLRYMNMDAQMAGDLVAMAKPVTKYSDMVLEPRSCLRMLRRAIKIALTPPQGPVYLCLPMDILDAPCTEDIIPTSIPCFHTWPDIHWSGKIVDILIHYDNPVFYIGNGIAKANAQEELVTLAEMVGAKVYEVDTGELNMPWSHPLYQGSTGHMFGSQSKTIFQQGDANVIIGTYLAPEVFPELDDIFKIGSKVIHIDSNAYEIAKNHRVDFSLVLDPKYALKSLIEAVEIQMNDEHKARIQARVDHITQEKQQKIAGEITQDQDKIKNDDYPLHFSQFSQALAHQIDKDNTIIFDEALTASPDLTRYIIPEKKGHFFQTRGGSLGVGIPGALGIKLYQPDKTVIAITGDGGAMYTIQALWTAVRYNIKAKFIICNNRSYKLLQLNIQNYWQTENIAFHEFPPSFDLSKPRLRFAHIAQSMGVCAAYVEEPYEITFAIEKMLAHDGPFLLDVVIKK